MLLVEQLDQRFLVAVHELRWVEVGGLVLQNPLGQFEHLGLDRDVGDIVEIVFRVPDLVRVAQRGRGEPLMPRLDHDNPLTLCEHDPPERYHALAAHSLADHGVGLLAGPTIRGDVVGGVEIALVDLVARNEGVDFDGVGALDRDGVKLIIVHWECRCSSRTRSHAPCRHPRQVRA